MTQPNNSLYQSPNQQAPYNQPPQEQPQRPFFKTTPGIITLIGSALLALLLVILLIIGLIRLCPT